jgi:hypothetical protein
MTHHEEPTRIPGCFTWEERIIYICVGLPIVVLTMLFVNKCILTRRNAIVRHGRRLQDLFGLPEWMRIFANEEPGMTNEDICRAGFVLVILLLLNGLCFAATVYEEGTIWHSGLLMAIVLTALVLSGTWLKLVLAKQDLEDRTMPDRLPLVEYEGFEKGFAVEAN